METAFKFLCPKFDLEPLGLVMVMDANLFLWSTLVVFPFLFADSAVSKLTLPTATPMSPTPEAYRVFLLIPNSFITNFVGLINL
jgi:hypothetical protein